MKIIMTNSPMEIGSKMDIWLEFHDTENIPAKILRAATYEEWLQDRIENNQSTMLPPKELGFDYFYEVSTD